jgi:hypothetical protein
MPGTNQKNADDIECSCIMIKKKDQLLLQQAVLALHEFLGETLISPESKKAEVNEECISTANPILPLNRHSHTIDCAVLLKKTLIQNDVPSNNANSTSPICTIVLNDDASNNANSSVLLKKHFF